jgi:DNA invertase Pin-like site-specific DNA recombinase
MPAAYSYTRVSSKRQVDNFGPQRQRETFTKLCAEHGLTPQDEFLDLGRSAFKGNKQTGLERFTQLVDDGTVKPGSWLVIENLDRFSRQEVADTQLRLIQLVKKGITVCTESMVLDSKSISDPFNAIRIVIDAERAHKESQRKSEFTKKNWQRKYKLAQDGKKLGGKIPSWLTFKDGKFELIPDRVAVIKKIFKMAVKKDLGALAIVHELNSQNIPTFGKGKEWALAIVQKIMNDGRVVGRFNSSTGVVIDDYYPAVVSQADFDRYQAAKKSRTHYRGSATRKVSNLFLGIAYDVETGTTMTREQDGKDKPAYWLASHYQRNKDRAISFRYDVWEREFLSFINEVTISDVAVEDENAKEIEKLESELAKIAIRLEELKTALTQTQSSPVELANAIAELDKQKKNKAGEILELRSTKPTDALNASQNILDKLGTAKGEALIELRSQLRQAIRNLVSRIDVTITKDGWDFDLNAVVTFHSGHKRRLWILTRRGKHVTSLWTVDDKPIQLPDLPADQQKLKEKMIKRGIATFDVVNPKTFTK